MKRAKIMVGGIAVLLAAVGLVYAIAYEKTVRVDESFNNQTVDMAVGDRLVLSLPSNPTTAYSWTYREQPSEQVLEEVRQWYESDSMLIGSGGSQYWEYKAVAPGSASIKLIYSRPWNNKPPAKEFTLSVNVDTRAGRVKKLF